jgi:basic amino acid/polyamine antiporter, APA family
MARKLTGLAPVLDVSTLAAVAYGEIGSSLYFALGIIALYALGVTPWVVLALGLLFLLITLSYAEGTAVFPETGGAATFVRRAFNDPAGFLTGWLLFLDYLIVIALAALFVPHYVGNATGWDAITDEPWDVVAGVGVIAAIAAVRLVRRAHLYQLAIFLAAVAITTHVLLVVLGFAFLFSVDALTTGVDLGTAPTWHNLAFAIPLGMLAFTGLETVANLASETHKPEKSVPRGVLFGIGTVVVVSVLVAIVGISAYPAHPDPGGPGGWSTALGDDWLRAPLVGIVVAFGGHLSDTVVDTLKVAIGVTGALVLAAAVSTSISGVGRLAYSLARHEMLPHAFARLSRRTLIPPISIVASSGIAAALLVLADLFGSPVRALAALYSLGILLAFAAAQLAVLRLRMTAPDLERPYRAPGNIRIRGVSLPVPALVGLPLTLAVLGVMLATHHRTIGAGAIWLALGTAVYVTVRTRHREHLMKPVQPAEADLVPEVEGMYRRILVPLKAGPIGEDVLGTAIKLAEEHAGKVTALHVIRVPLEHGPDTALPEEEQRAEATLARARRLADEHGVEIEGKVVRHSDLGTAIVDEAVASGAELIVMGSSPRWRRWSRFVSPTVDKVLRRAPSEVMVVAYPDGYFDEDGAPDGHEPS